MPSKSQAWTPEVVEMEAPAGAAPFVATATRNSGKQARRSDLARGSTDLTMWRDRAACLEHWPLNQKCLALLVHPRSGSQRGEHRGDAGLERAHRQAHEHDPPRFDQVQEAPHGSIDIHTYSSGVSKAQRGLYVYVPPVTDRVPLSPAGLVKLLVPW